MEREKKNKIVTKISCFSPWVWGGGGGGGQNWQKVLYEISSIRSKGHSLRGYFNNGSIF